MRDFGQIRRGFWTDPWVKRLSDPARLLAMYLIAGPHTNALGFYYCPPGYMATDLAWAEPKLACALEELSAKGFVTVSDDGYVLVERFLKHNEPQNGNVGKHVAALFHEVDDDHPLKARVALALDRYGTNLPEGFLAEIQPLADRARADQGGPGGGDGNGSETVSEGSRNIEREKDTEKDTDTETDPERDPEKEKRGALGLATPTEPREVFTRLPCVGKGATPDGEPIFADELPEWQIAYPGLDVGEQLHRMRAWLKAKPDRRKTVSGVRKFIVNWLSRQQDAVRGGGGGTVGDHNQATARVFAGGGTSRA